MAGESEHTTEKVPHQKPNVKKSRSRHVVPQIADVLKVTVWIVVLIFIFFHWGYFSDWFRATTHLELPGVKLDRFVQASAKIEKYASTPRAKETSFNRAFAESAIARARRVAPALKGALVLWADDRPENNSSEREILGDFGIRFVNVKSTDEAMQRLDRDSYDLIISSSRQNEPAEPLTVCPVHYFEWPFNVPKEAFKDDLDAFNKHINAAAPGGFVFMDRVKAKYKENAPPIIFYSASTGRIVTSLCSKTITNRADVLFQSVISSLEEQRWQELSVNTHSEEDSTQSSPVQ